MRTFIIIFFIAIFYCTSCNQSSSDTKQLESKVDSLQKQLNNTYKPGLGEFMLGIQMHHAKLWYAGQGQNWPLANFELEEIDEAVGDIQQYCAERDEVRSINIITPPMESLRKAIEKKDKEAFTNDFTLLTQACNSCHVATKHGFNVIKIPDALPVGNQKFGL